MASLRHLQRSLADVVTALQSTGAVTIFLGAGISRAAGIPLAGEIVARLAQRLRGLDAPEGGGDGDVWEWLEAQPFYDRGNPYASVLDTAFSNRTQRARYFQELIHGKVPTNGHLAIANLMRYQVVSAVLTTNFDRLMEHAIVRVCRCMPCVLLFDELPSHINIWSDRPKVLKLHGDYLFGNIRNLERELQLVKESMSAKIGIAAQRGPCIVAGYSGADRSVMEAFECLAADSRAFIGGVYWLMLEDAMPRDRVLDFLYAVSNRGSGVVKIEDADGFFGDLEAALAPSAAPAAVPSHPGVLLEPIVPEDICGFVQERLDDLEASEFLELLRRRPWLGRFVRTIPALDYLLARYKEGGGIPGNVGELVDRYVDLLIGGLAKGSAARDGGPPPGSRAAQRERDLEAAGLLTDGHGQDGASIFRRYVEALRLMESRLDPDKIGAMLADEGAYEELRLYVGLLQDATHVVRTAIHQSVDQIVLHGRIRRWPDTFYKAAALVGSAAYVDKGTVEWIVDLLLLEFDVERWHPRGAIAALTAMGNATIEHLLPYMLDPLQDTFSREDAAIALGRIGTRQVVEALAKAGAEASSRNVKMVVYALGHTGNPRTIKALRDLAPKVSTLSEWVLRNALTSLGYEGTDILAGARSEEPDPRPEVDADAVLREHGIDRGRSPVSHMLQELFRKSSQECMKLIRGNRVPREATFLSSVAVRLLAQNRPWQSEVVCAECLERYPMLSQSYHNLALSYSRQGRPIAARRYYALGSSLNPDYGDYYSDFGIVMEKLGNLEAARYLYVRAISVEPDNYRPWLNLAHVYLAESGVLSGPGIKDTPDGDPLRPGLYTVSSGMKLDIAADVGRARDASICLRQVLMLEPDHPTAGSTLAHMRLLYGQLPDSAPTPQELVMALHLGETVPGGIVHIESLPTDAREAWTRSADHLYQGNLMGAIIAMEEVLAAYSDSPNVYHNLSLLYSAADLRDNAVQYAEEGLAKWPTDYDMLLNYSSLLLRAERFRDAIAAAEKAVAVRPYHAASWYNLALVLLAGERRDEAADACREAIRFAPRWSKVEMQAQELLREIDRADRGERPA